MFSVVVPDPRKARGKRYCWLLLLTLIAAGLASGHQSAHAIAHWIALHLTQLQAALPTFRQPPSESTILRTLRMLDVTLLERALAQLTAPQSASETAQSQLTTPQGTLLQVQAVDGKTLRGATACGTPTHLVSLVQHTSGVTIAQAAVAQKRNEISAVPALLAGRDLTDTVITMDALLTQRALAQQIIAQGGFYLMLVKANQKQLRDDVALFFELPAIAADHEQTDTVTTITREHGRLETRTLRCISGDWSCVGWPGATHLIRRSCQRQVLSTGKTSCSVTYGITNLPCAETSAVVVEKLWRGHWTIESGSHYVRDVTLGEDANHMCTGHAPEVLAALRNGLLALWRRAGWSNIADAVRATGASVSAALTFIGAT